MVTLGRCDGSDLKLFLEEFNDFVHMFQVPRRFPEGDIYGVYIKKDCLAHLKNRDAVNLYGNKDSQGIIQHLIEKIEHWECSL